MFSKIVKKATSKPGGKKRHKPLPSISQSSEEQTEERSQEGNFGARVFLSYCVAGVEGVFVHNLVEQLYQDLTANGCQVWGYERNSSVGTQFREEYKRVIQESDFFVVFCNELARKSPFISEEIETAVSASRSIKIIPILLDIKGTHPSLKKLYLSVIPYYDKKRRNRVYLLHRLLKAMGAPLSVPPGDKFTAFDMLWKVYQRDPEFYPVCNPDCIRVLGTESHRMDIQTEEDFIYGSMQLTVHSNWRTDTTLGFEKWYGHARYSITLQGDGNAWMRWQGRLWTRGEHFPVDDWRRIQQRSIRLRIDWGKTETAVSVNNTVVCQTRTRIHCPLKLRLNADFSDYLVVTDISYWEPSQLCQTPLDRLK